MRKIIFILIFLSLIIKLYSYWRIKRILFSPIGGTASYPIVVDSDHNGYNEIIFSIYRCWEIWEYRPINQYYLVYADTGVFPYPPGIETGNFEPKDVGDIDQDGLVDLVGSNIENVNNSFYGLLTTMESPNFNSYPESLNWWYRVVPDLTPLTNPFYFTDDLDLDTKKEILAGIPNIEIGLGIWENISNNQNELVWHSNTEDGYSYTFGDFDLDGKKEIVTTGLGSLGRVFIYENTGDNQYQLIKVDTVRLPNGSDVFSGNDVDNDGKPEFFVGFAEWAGGHA